MSGAIDFDFKKNARVLIRSQLRPLLYGQGVSRLRIYGKWMACCRNSILRLK